MERKVKKQNTKNKKYSGNQDEVVKERVSKKHNRDYSKDFLINSLLFLSIVAILNFSVYVFNGGIKNNKIFSNDFFANQKTTTPGVFSYEGISFNYPVTSKISGNKDSLTIDNWNINFFDKDKKFSSFEKWFSDKFLEKNCEIKNLNITKDSNFGYDLFFIDNADCNNGGFYMVGQEKIGKINLGVDPNKSYEEVMASIKF